MSQRVDIKQTKIPTLTELISNEKTRKINNQKQKILSCMRQWYPRKMGERNSEGRSRWWQLYTEHLLYDIFSICLHP